LKCQVRRRDAAPSATHLPYLRYRDLQGVLYLYFFGFAGKGLFFLGAAGTWRAVGPLEPLVAVDDLRTLAREEGEGRLQRVAARQIKEKQKEAS
jgi:hypothetical protein